MPVATRRWIPEEIDKMESGPEMDALIAEKVMGLIPCASRFYMPLIAGAWDEIHCEHIDAGKSGICFDPDPDKVPRYSTSIATAWKVVEKVAQLNAEKKEGWGSFDLGDRIKDGKVEYYAIFSGKNLPNSNEVSADTAPLAICRAALKATLGIEKGG